MSSLVSYSDILRSHDFDFDDLRDFGIETKRHVESAEISYAFFCFDFLFVDVEAERSKCAANHFARDRTEHFAVVFSAFCGDFDSDVFKFVCNFLSGGSFCRDFCVERFFSLFCDVDILLSAFLSNTFFDKEVAGVSVVDFDDFAFFAHAFHIFEKNDFHKISLICTYACI